LEILPVTPDNAEKMDGYSLPDFSHVAIKHFSFVQDEEKNYRVYTADGMTTDVYAENASHAYQVANRKDVVKIIRIEFAHNDIVDKRDMQPTGKEITPATADTEKPQLVAEFADVTEQEPFAALNAAEFAATYHKS
jgi:hypothetical protein